MAHRNAPLTPRGRLLLCRRIATGSPVALVAAQMGISRHCATKWWLRDQELGEKGLSDRPSQPVTSPRRTRSGSRRRSAGSAGPRGSGRTGSPGASASPPRPCTACSPVTTSAGFASSTGDLGSAWWAVEDLNL